MRVARTVMREEICHAASEILCISLKLPGANFVREKVYVNRLRESRDEP